MKRTRLQQPATDPSTAVLGGDVCRDRIDAYTELAGEGLEWSFANEPEAVDEALRTFRERARLAGKTQVLVAVESTGPYSELVLRTARRLGLATAWVSAESVCKMRSIESHDDSKTDPKDARCIYRLAAVMGKTLRHRELPGEHAQLRELHAMYAGAEEAVSAARNEARDVLRRLFPSFGFSSGFLFGRSGQALVKLYGADPARILAESEERFEAAMRSEAKGVQARSLRKLRRQAGANRPAFLGPELAAVLSLRLQHLFEDLSRHGERKELLRERMVELYERLRECDRQLPAPTRGVVSAFHLARIVAETGPLGDFESWRQLQRLAGLNLTEKKSGTWRGRTKLSKKGRPLLRKVLGHCVLPLVKRGGLLGEQHRRHREERGRSGTESMATLSRKFLKMLWGWARSGREFDPVRAVTCESVHRLAA